MEPHSPATRAITSDRSPARAAVDNLLRRSLKISDPYNADEVAKGLLARYPEDAAKMKREQMGLPFSVMAAQPAVVAPARVGRPEVTEASDRLERALTELTTSPDLADILPEMRGWATTLRRAATDGLSSAPYAIDVGERDRGFAARRVLGDYARLARYAGAVTACATEVYCRLAQACDLAANIILVLIGDALGDAGVTRSGALIQVSTATLQARRDAVITALRNLLQLTPTGDQETWPRGSKAVQQIYAGLAATGSAELRALLDEAHLARQLDDLIDLATGSTPDGLRALGSTAAVSVQRLERFRVLADALVYPDSPPATTFLVELQLFIQSFQGTRSGYRLPYLAQSPLLVSRSKTTGALDQPTQDLLALALLRSALADAIDCLCCCCNPADMGYLIVAGKALSDLDRAIDLYALGTDHDGLGDAEWSAALYGAAIFTAGNIPNNPMSARLLTIAGLLKWRGIVGTPGMGDDRIRQFEAILNGMIHEETQWSELVSSIAPLCRQELLFDGIPEERPAETPPDPIGALLHLTVVEVEGQVGGPIEVPRAAPEVLLPAALAINANRSVDDDRYADFQNP